MINLECLGLGPPEIWLSRADERLRDAYAAVAKVLSIPLIGMNVDRVGDDDSHSFIRVGIPVLTIHSLNSDTIHLIHRPADKVSAIHPDKYYATYRLVARVSRVCRYRDPVAGPVRYRASSLTVAAL